MKRNSNTRPSWASITGRIQIGYLYTKLTVMHLLKRTRKAIAEFLFGPNKKKVDQLAAAEDFQDVLREATVYEQPIFLTVRCGGREETVMLHPDTELVGYLYRWSQAWIFRIGVGDVELPADTAEDFDSQMQRQIKGYMRYWAEIMIKDRTLPVVLVCRREPDNQSIIVTPGHSEGQLLEILDKAKLLVPNILSQIKIVP
jgi:hypothetical protein